MPEAQGPEEDRDEVLNPAVERGQTECHCRQMGRCCVVEDTDQNIDREEKPSSSENETYISGDSRVCTASGSELERHLSSPLPVGVELLRALTADRTEPPHGNPSVPILHSRVST
jgi:hypothetical protein